MKFDLFNLAMDYGWKMVYFRKEILFTFRRNCEKLTLFKDKKNGKWVVHTVIRHPKQGLTKVRREIHLHELEKIFDNPRMHTGVGHHMKLFEKENG